MDFKRKISKKEQSELQRTLRGVGEKHRKPLVLVGGIGALLLITGIWFGTSVWSDPEYDEHVLLDASPWVRKHVVVNEDSATGFLEGNTESKDNNTQISTGISSDIGMLAGDDIRYYVMFPVYEATVAQINGDWDDDGVLNASKSDGGLGPIGETHSGLPNTIEAMYDSDPVEFEYLKEFAENPMLYMKRCDGNDRRNHKWPSNTKNPTDHCVTYWDGSLKVRNAIMDAIWGKPDRIKKYYDAYLGANVTVYLGPAKAKLSEITGKPVEELGFGTVGTLFAIYVRYGQAAKYTNGCTASMSEDELIAQMNANAYAKGGEARFKCATGIAQRMNRGEIDIYGYYGCTGECNSGYTHAIMNGRSYGDLFGKGNSNE